MMVPSKFSISTSITLVVLLLSIPVLSFSFFSPDRESSEASPWTADTNTDALAKALSLAFPSKIHQDPAYSSALTIFRSLESKPSCHRTAAASLVNSCYSLDDKNEDGGLKVSYAAQLAVCELEATGVGFPRECNGLQEPGKRRDGKNILRCIQKLEQRPQWWTTLSNNIQNAVVMCSAVRHEIEKDQLLILHKNITKVQQSLFTVLDTSLNEAWRSLALQKEFTGDWRRVFAEAIRALTTTNDEFTDSLRNVETKIREVFEKLLTETQVATENNQNAVAQLEKSIYESRKGLLSMKDFAREFWDDLEQSAGQVARKNSDVIRQNSDLIQKTNAVLSTEIATAVDRLLGLIELLAGKIESSTANLEKFESLTESYTSLFASLSQSYFSLAQSRSNLSSSLEEQEIRQNELLSSLERAQATVNTTLENTLNIATQINMSLSEADERIKALSRGQSWGPLMIFILGLVVLMGKEGAKLFVGFMGIAVGTLLLLIANLNISSFGEKISIVKLFRPDLERVFELDILSVAGERTIAAYYREPLPARLVFGICGVLVLATLMLLIAVRNVPEPTESKPLLSTEEVAAEEV